MDTHFPSHGKLNVDNPNKNPLFQISHKFANMNFMQICNGILYKNFWENKTKFTSIPHVQ